MRYSICLLLVLACQTSFAGYRLETVTDQLVSPWSVAFLPDGSYLVTERGGNLRRVSAKGVTANPCSAAPQPM